MEKIPNKSIGKMYIIGGGSRNALLCQLVVNTTGLPVYAGPAEATAIGNIMIQEISMGEIDSIAEGRKIIKESYKIKNIIQKNNW